MYSGMIPEVLVSVELVEVAACRMFLGEIDFLKADRDLFILPLDAWNI